ncbi:MAG: hypothetical protein SFY68_03675 [Candidatus Sumerlaeia bacterium]|nr:hypothetical protein [Candidatus Sumerlaeia bacterium]
MNELDERIEKGLAELPQAPEGSAFRARVMASVAVVRQHQSSGEVLALSDPMEPLALRFAYGLGGFVLGITCFLVAMLLLLPQGIGSPTDSTLSGTLTGSVFLPALEYDPLETATRELIQPQESSPQEVKP